MKHFLILFDEMPIDKVSVKSGDNSPEVITAARCVNVGLFISGDLRRDVIVSVAVGTPENLLLISFPGAELKRVSPDERSISFFLLKAFEEAKMQKMNFHRIMDNGIVARRSSLFYFIDSYTPEKIYFANSKVEPVLSKKIEYENSLLIYSNSEQLSLELNDSKWNLEQLYRPSHPERFILDVNMLSDRDAN